MCIRINDDKKRDLLTKHYKPENCENLQIPKVKKGIWTSLGRRAQDNDLKLQNSQHLFARLYIHCCI